MVRSTCVTLFLTVLAAASCSFRAPAPLAVERVRSLRIMPAAPSACPGEKIQASYVAVLDNDSTLVIEPDQLSALDRDGISAAPERSGAWSTETDPLLTARSGFVLRARLRDKLSVATQVVVSPDYTCPQDFVRQGADLTVRVGQLRSPFYDSLIVIAVTAGSGPPTHIVLDGAKATRPAVDLWAAGETGRPGTPGPTGGAGKGSCSIGSDGGDGTAGHPGGKGGSFTIYVEAGHRDLLGFLSTHSGGGAGGPGGAARQRWSGRASAPAGRSAL